MKSLVSLFLLFFLTFQVSATEIMWLKLSGQISYRDVTKICSTSFSSTAKALFFSAEIENDKLVYATLRNSSSYPQTEAFEFTEDELQAIKLFKDSYGSYWLDEFPLSEQAAVWAFLSLGGYCTPPKPLKSVEPNLFRFQFETESLGEEVMLSASNEIQFEGLREDGRSYKASLKFIQRLQDSKEQ